MAALGQGQPLGSRRKFTLKNKKERRERPHFTPDDIVLAIKGVKKAGLEVYGVEITSLVRPNPINTSSANRTIQHPPKNKLSLPHEFRYSRRIDCADYYHRHFCSRHGRSFPSVSHDAHLTTDN
jgi:hypothetical protein